MIVIYSSRLLRVLSIGSENISGMALFPFIILKDEIKNTSESRYTINHERIHIRQQVELLIFLFIGLYFFSYLTNRLRGCSRSKAYLNNVFEKEAYDNMYDLRYLKRRKSFAFFQYYFRNIGY